MQTTMVPLLQAPTSPAAGKTSPAKGAGLFEELLGENTRQSTKAPQGTDPFELLAAALTFGWQPTPILPDGAGVVSEAELKAVSVAVAADPALALTSVALPLLSDLAQNQELALEPPQGPAQKLVAASLPTTESATELLGGKPLGVAAQTEAPVAPAARDHGVPTPAIQVAQVAQVAQATMPVKEALAPLQPLPEKVAEMGGVRPEIELQRGQKKLSEAGFPAGETVNTEVADEEPATEGSAKVAGLSEARFSDMLKGAVKSAPQVVAQRGAAPRGEIAQEIKSAPARDVFAAAADPLIADAEPAAAPATPVPSAANTPQLSAVTAPPQPPAAAVPASPAATLQLPSGQVVAENELLGQVLGRLHVGVRRESSSISMRLNPEELGEVKLDLLVEKDRVRALIVTQSQQVQEVLERHLPRLREALQQQGLKLEDLQVSVDSRQQDNSRGFFQHEQRAANNAHTGGQRGAGRVDGEQSELPQTVSASATGGLSIRI